MGFEIRTISAFEKDFKKLSKKYPSLKSDLLKLIRQLEANPFLGASLGKDFYKVRLNISSKGKGKSGGLPLSAIYYKSERSTITDAELKLLANQIG